MAIKQKPRVVVGPASHITVHSSPKVLYDIDALQELRRGMLGARGCMTRHSGLPITFQIAEGEHEL